MNTLVICTLSGGAVMLLALILWIIKIGPPKSKIGYDVDGH